MNQIPCNPETFCAEVKGSSESKSENFEKHPHPPKRN